MGANGASSKKGNGSKQPVSMSQASSAAAVPMLHPSGSAMGLWVRFVSIMGSNQIIETVSKVIVFYSAL